MIFGKLVCSLAVLDPRLGKSKVFHTRFRALGSELILVYRQSARR